MHIPTKKVFDRVLEALDSAPMMIRSASEYTGLSKPSVQSVVHILHDNDLAHIERWDMVMKGLSRDYIPVYAFGFGIDAEKPPTQSREQKLAAKRAYREKSQIAKIEDEIRERIRQELARPAFRDPFIAAFFGEYRRAA